MKNLSTKIRLFCGGGIVTILCLSCEKQAIITYSVFNQSELPIKVVFYNTDTKDTLTSNIEDSILVEINSTETLTVQGKGVSRVSNYKETDEFLREFKYLKIYQNNSESKSNFLKSSKWNYSEKDNHSASYTCIVYQSDF